MTINVIINGVHGKMGAVTQTSIADQPDLTLVAGIGRSDDLTATIQNTRADVVVDFTLPDAVFDNAQTLIAAGARPVIGTSGLTPQQIEQLATQCQQKKLGGIIAPNFSLGAVLMMKYAKDAARYFPDAEIIEMHHEQKVDAPSGTATKTAQMMTEARSTHDENTVPSQDPARGDHQHGVTIHSVRLPGLFAHQTVLFGGDGETLTIRHDGLARHSIMPGVFLACRQVMTLDHLVYGLENLL